MLCYVFGKQVVSTPTTVNGLSRIDTLPPECAPKGGTGERYTEIAAGSVAAVCEAGVVARWGEKIDGRTVGGSVGRGNRDSKSGGPPFR